MPIEGSPDPKHVSTSYAERQNLTMRMQMQRFTRLTNAFSKKFENHMHMVALYTVWYNYVKQHKALKGISPAMAAGISDTLWSVTDLAEMVDTAAAKPGKRGPYKKTAAQISTETLPPRAIASAFLTKLLACRTAAPAQPFLGDTAMAAMWCRRSSIGASARSSRRAMRPHECILASTNLAGLHGVGGRPVQPVTCRRLSCSCYSCTCRHRVRHDQYRRVAGFARTQ